MPYSDFRDLHMISMSLRSHHYLMMYVWVEIIMLTMKLTESIVVMAIIWLMVYTPDGRHLLRQYSILVRQSTNILQRYKRHIERTWRDLLGFYKRVGSLFGGLPVGGIERI